MYGVFILTSLVLVSLITHNLAYELANVANPDFLQETGHGWAVWQKSIFYAAFIGLTVSILFIGLTGKQVLNSKTVKIIIASQFVFYTNLEIIERLQHGASLTTLNTNNVYLWGILIGFALNIILVLSSLFIVRLLEKVDFFLPIVSLKTIYVVTFYKKLIPFTKNYLCLERGPPAAILAYNV